MTTSASTSTAPSCAELRGVPLSALPDEAAGVAIRIDGGRNMSAESGQVGDTLVITPGGSGDWSVRLEYRGGATLSPTGERRGAGGPCVFSYGRFEPRTDRAASFVRWRDTIAKTLSIAAFDSPHQGKPDLSRQERRLDYMWYRPAIKDLPRSRWAAEAKTSVTLGAGQYLADHW